MTCISPVSLTLKSICELSTFFFSKCNVDYNFEFNSCPSISFRRRQWHPTPVLLPGKSHGWRSLVGCTPCKGSDTAERLPFHFSLSCIGEGNGNTLQGSCLENPRDGGAWWAAVYGVTQSRTRLKWLSSSSSISFSLFMQGDREGLSLMKICSLTNRSHLFQTARSWRDPLLFALGSLLPTSLLRLPFVQTFPVLKMLLQYKMGWKLIVTKGFKVSDTFHDACILKEACL